MDKPNNAPLPALRSEDDPPRHQDDALAYTDDLAEIAKRKATARGLLPASDERALDREAPAVACAECHRTITPHERREADGGAQLHAIGCAAEWFRRQRDEAEAALMALWHADRDDVTLVEGDMARDKARALLVRRGKMTEGK